jgi:hypothetical protein
MIIETDDKLSMGPTNEALGHEDVCGTGCVFLTRALVGDKWSASRLGRFT